MKYPAAVVANLDTHQMKGSHWVVINAEGLKREVIYFDSLALPLSEIMKTTFLKKFPKIVQNKIPYQSPISNTCAHFCIVFIYYVSQGYTFNEILSIFEKNLNNDTFVKKVVNKIIE